MSTPTANPELLLCLKRLAQWQHATVDPLELQQVVESAWLAHPEDPRGQLHQVAKRLSLPIPDWRNKPDATHLPALLHAREEMDGRRWGVLKGLNAGHQWMSEWWDGATGQWREQVDETLDAYLSVVVGMRKPFVASDTTLYRLIRQAVLARRGILRDLVIGGLLINAMAMAVSFYSMQVYDRVIPNNATQTLLVLTLGVLIALLFEWITRHVRTRLFHQLIDQVDQDLARTLYRRFLAIRLDQLPQHVGSLASQMRGYETVRGFFTSIIINLFIDFPFALVFTVVIALIADRLVIIVGIFFVLSLLLGILYRGKIEGIAKHAFMANNLKTGLLVETIEGAETIKSGQGGWRMLTRWMANTDDARANELAMRQISESLLHLTTAFQQVTYILMIAFGATRVSQGDLTMGGLLACSILAGRVLSPVAMIPHQLTQWAHAKAALQGMDHLWNLQDDHHGQPHPIQLDRIGGQYQFESVVAEYRGRKALVVPELRIAPGDKIGVLGPVGAGKTTLLRLLSGMYKPQEGRILLDDIDLAHIAKPALSERMGYLQQEGRLFSGTLRENLILGLIDPGDDRILEAARQTGLLDAVIRQHPKGLQQEIHEGGTGLSGGQRQLVNLTRVVLRKPAIWLLDEPTASVDRNLEMRILQTLHGMIRPEDTLVLVTHKPEMLALVERLIVIANHQIILDGPKEWVLRRLQSSGAEKAA